MLGSQTCPAHGKGYGSRFSSNAPSLSLLLADFKIQECEQCLSSSSVLMFLMVNEKLVRSTKECFLEVAQVLSVCVYFCFGMCCASFSTGSRDGSLAPPFLERTDSPTRMMLAPQETPAYCGCGVGPWVCGRLSEVNERSAPFTYAGICKVRPRLMQPKFELL